MTVVTKEINKFVPENRWIALLSNGEVIYEDHIPGLSPSWERLAAYIRENNLSIVELSGLVAGCEIILPRNQEGYVQYKKVQATGTWSCQSLCIGFVQGGLSKVYMIGADKSSQSLIISDPGAPKTIYNRS